MTDSIDSPTSPQVVSPVYWHSEGQPQEHASRKGRPGGGLRSPIIRLEDNTVDEESEQYRALWAKSCRIEDYVIITGSMPKLGDYVVYNCTITTANVRR